MEKHPVSAVVLAAGYSTRMGAFKPLLALDGRPAIRHLTENILRSGVRHIIIVTGHRREEIPPALESLREGVPATGEAGMAADMKREGLGQSASNICFAHNPDFAKGMFTSIQTGIRAALTDAAPDGILLFPVDVPLVPAGVVRKLIRESKAHPDAFSVPCFLGKKGHPLWVPAPFFQSILSHDGKHGLKGITEKPEVKFHYMECGTEAAVMDMDTPEGYQEILDFLKESPGLKASSELEESTGRPEINSLLPGRRILLVRHGSTEQHRAKIFLGQTDVPLSEKGRREAAEAASALKKLTADARRIYSSDLLRARETAEILAACWHGDKGQASTAKKHPVPAHPETTVANRQAPAHPEITAGVRQAPAHPEITAGVRRAPEAPEIFLLPELREMHLGDWDGRYIEEIRAAFPEEYERRGKDLLRYKRGNKGENFYDLRYRALKALRKIGQIEAQIRTEWGEEKEPQGDIIIVSHLGIIRAVSSLLTGCSPEEAWRMTFSRGSVTAYAGSGRGRNSGSR